MAFRLHALIALLDAVLGLANGTSNASNASNASSWRVGAVCEGSTNIAQTMRAGSGGKKTMQFSACRISLYLRNASGSKLARCGLSCWKWLFWGRLGRELPRFDGTPHFFLLVCAVLLSPHAHARRSPRAGSGGKKTMQFSA